MVTNTAKHAQPSSADIAVSSADEVLRIVARDEGIGGGDPARGSGLVGLRDRVEALGGTISVQSLKDEGTTVEVALALAGDGRKEESLGRFLDRPPLATGQPSPRIHKS